MASFGFSIGDIILISNYAYSVYKSCQNAGDNFREITSDVASLRTLLIALDDECKNPLSSFQQLPLAQKGELAARLQDCKADLRSVKKILHDFRSLNLRDARYFDRLAFTTGKQAAIREKIATHSVRLQQLLTGINVGTFSRIERNTEAHYLSLLEIRAKLDRIHMDVLAGRRDATAFVNSEDVVALEDEVLDDHMTEVDVDVSYEVHAWVERVHAETSQPLSMPDNDVAAIEGDGTATSSSSDTCSVQEPSNTKSSRNDSHIRGDSPNSSGDGSDTDEQNSQSEDMQESLEAHEAPEGGYTPRFLCESERRALQYQTETTPNEKSGKELLALGYYMKSTPAEPFNLETHEAPEDGSTPRLVSDLEQRALRYQTSSKRTNPSEPTEHESTLIDLTNHGWYYEVVKSEEIYHFDEQDRCWVDQSLCHDKSRGPRVVREYVDVTLEEVFTGTSKQFTLRRSTVNPETHDSESFEDIAISLQIKRGVLNGNAICYVMQTDPHLKLKTSIVFKIRRKPHLLFQDLDGDLVHTIHLTSAEKKNGWKRKIQNVDAGRTKRNSDVLNSFARFAMAYACIDYRKETEVSIQDIGNQL
ncbi:uncharacterized protein J4E92_010248 [Alternaria infectoria]|uniref:uncharacterized protein n=1 Tax=Alternaria infectoria TaxID=45303 RepID=UPI00221FCBAF|nr:uncharacterized protein J4E92_010248 [Alternaria infectoria]KAI4911435.1 hypothetical protein J4E92_010248 [Alternaria infectoria]